METDKLEELDALILQEKRSIARQYFSDAWDAALSEGIEEDIMAEEIVRGVLLELARSNGQHAVSRFLNELSEGENKGAFIPDLTLQ